MIISYKTQSRRYWDLIPMTLSVYNALIIPFEISFGLVLIQTEVIDRIDLFIDIIFIIDLVLMFFTSY